MSRSHEIWDEAVAGIDEAFEFNQIDWSKISGFMDDSWTRERLLTAERTVQAEFECVFEGYPEPGQRLELARGEGLVHQEFELHVAESMPRDGFFKPRKADFEPTSRSYEIRSTTDILESPDLLKTEWQISDEQGQELVAFFEEKANNPSADVKLSTFGLHQRGPLNQPMRHIVLRQSDGDRIVSNNHTDLNPTTATILKPRSIETEEGLEALERSVASLRLSLDGLRANLGHH